MSLWQRFLHALGYSPLPRLSFHTDEDLIGALAAVAERENRRAEEIAHELLASALMQRLKENAAVEHWEALSPRERQVTALICLGHTNRQIAAALGLSPSTAKVHVRNILHKFGLRSREELRQALSRWDFNGAPGKIRLP